MFDPHKKRLVLTSKARYPYVGAGCWRGGGGRGGGVLRFVLPPPVKVT